MMDELNNDVVVVGKLKSRQKAKKKKSFIFDYLLVVLVLVLVVLVFSFILVSMQLKRVSSDYEGIVGSYNSLSSENRQCEVDLNSCMDDLGRQEKKADYYFEGYLSCLNDSVVCKK